MSARLRALVSGGPGFIGSALRQALHEAGWNVFSITRKSSAGRSRSFLGSDLIHDGTTAGMIGILRRARPDVIFHLASLFLVEHQPKDVEALCRSNILFGTQLLEAAASVGVTRFVNTGTAWQHYENARYNPVNLYAATKQAFEDVLEYYVQARGMAAVTLKIFESYGPGDERPKIWKALREANASPLKFSAGRQKIDPVYVGDVVQAYLIAAGRLLKQKIRGHEIYALSSGRPRALREIVDIYSQVTGKKIFARWGARPYRAREVMTPWIGGKRLPGWRPRISLERGILLSETTGKA